MGVLLAGSVAAGGRAGGARRFDYQSLNATSPPQPPGLFALAWDGTGTGQWIIGCEVHNWLPRGQISYPASVASLNGRLNPSMPTSWKGSG